MSLGSLQFEFETPETTDDRRIEIIHEVQLILADTFPEDEVNAHRCINCKEIRFHAPYDHALTGGHVYSQAGLQETAITGYCEFCFDNLFKEEN